MFVWPGRETESSPSCQFDKMDSDVLTALPLYYVCSAKGNRCFQDQKNKENGLKEGKKPLKTSMNMAHHEGINSQQGLAC